MILQQLCFDGPTDPHLHKAQRGWWTWSNEYVNVGKSETVREWHCAVDGAEGGTHGVVVQVTRVGAH